jgi:FkbM family methyltransferase
MNDRMLYKIRGWAYTAACLNPFTNTIAIGDLPLGVKLLAYKRDAVGRGLYRRKIHEPALTNLLLTRFANPAPKNFIDVGANIGYFSCLMSMLAGPSGQVLAIEPEPQNLKLLERNILNNHLQNVRFFPYALGSSEGSAMLGLYKSSNRGRHSMVAAGARFSIVVRVQTLDELVRSAAPDVTSWALVKIDVEGYEGFVLEGASETLPKIQMLVMEFSPALLEKTGVDPAALLQKLCVQFKRIYRIENAELVLTSAKDCLISDNQLELVFERS